MAHITALSELSVSSSTHTDDSRSSGYRSSSSPSIQSEELYVNESAIGSMEESPTNSSPDIMSTLPHLKEIGVGTTESLPKDNTKKKSKKDKKEKEAKREKERLQAEAVEREVLSKKSLERPKSKAPKPPKTYFTDSHVNPVKIDLPSVNTEERKKRLFEALDQKEQQKIQNDEQSNQDHVKNHPKEQTILKSTPPTPPEETKKSNIKKNKDAVADHQPKKQIEFKEPKLPKEKPVSTSTKKDEKLNKKPSPQVAKKVPSPQISKQNSIQIQESKDQGTMDKKPSQKDRSVDVYHETVRQRATRNSEAIKEVFADVQEENTTNTQTTSIKKPNRKKNRAPQNPQKDINDEDLPSVKELRSKFENEKSKNPGTTNNNSNNKKIENSNTTATPSDSIPPASKKSAFKPTKIDFKKGFNVMSSLTRRSAMSVSKSMQNLHVDQSAAVPAADTKKVEEMEFSHFTYSDTEINHKEQAKHQDDDAGTTTKKVTGGGGSSSSSGKKKQESTKKEVEFYEFRKPSPTEDHATSYTAATDHQELVDPDPVYVNVESTKKVTRQLQQQPSAADEHGVQVQHRSRNGGESSAANKLLQLSLETDEEEDNQTGLGPWNPIKIVAHLYKVEEIKPLAKNGEGGGTNNHHLNHELEGYIERLPPGKKKSTIWNSWKRQYFVAKAGLLLIFGDSSRTVLMDRIELFGGRVDYMESTMLGIQDRRGHYVVLRFKDNEDADKWHSGLSNHVSHDLAQTFVTPVINSNPDLFKNILIIDFGGSSVRAGIASSMPTLPQLFFPSVMAIGKGHEDEKYFGMDAFAPEIRSRCNLVHPFAPSSNIDKYTVNQV